MAQRLLSWEWPLKAHSPLEFIPRQNTCFRFVMLVYVESYRHHHPSCLFDADDTVK